MAFLGELYSRSSESDDRVPTSPGFDKEVGEFLEEHGIDGPTDQLDQYRESFDSFWDDYFEPPVRKSSSNDRYLENLEGGLNKLKLAVDRKGTENIDQSYIDELIKYAGNARAAKDHAEYQKSARDKLETLGKI